MRAGVELVTGLFNETLGPFLEVNSGAVLFLNIDNDLYESCVEIFAIEEASRRWRGDRRRRRDI